VKQPANTKTERIPWSRLKKTQASPGYYNIDQKSLGKRNGLRVRTSVVSRGDLTERGQDGAGVGPQKEGLLLCYLPDGVVPVL